MFSRSKGMPLNSIGTPTEAQSMTIKSKDVRQVRTVQAQCKTRSQVTSVVKWSYRHHLLWTCCHATRALPQRSRPWSRVQTARKLWHPRLSTPPSKPRCQWNGRLAKTTQPMNECNQLLLAHHSVHRKSGWYTFKWCEKNSEYSVLDMANGVAPENKLYDKRQRPMWKCRNRHKQERETSVEGWLWVGPIRLRLQR